MTPAEMGDLLLGIANSFERMETENAVLRNVLLRAVPRPGEPPLQTQADDLMREAANKPTHERYEQLRAEIRQAAEEHRLQELLVRFASVGKPN